MTWFESKHRVATWLVAMILAFSPAAFAQLGQDGARAPDDGVEEGAEAVEPDEQPEAADEAEGERADEAALVDQEADEQPAAARQEAERPTVQESSRLDDGERSITGGTLALISYIALWVLVFGFVFAILRRQRRLDAELDELEGRLDQVFEDVE